MFLNGAEQFIALWMSFHETLIGERKKMTPNKANSAGRLTRWRSFVAADLRC